MLTLNSLFLLAEEDIVSGLASIAPNLSPMQLVTIFVLGIYIGVEVITKIPPILHTPLMSGSNAISGITVIGAIYAAGQGNHTFLKILGSIAVAFAMINVVGGFLVTHRMLEMFQNKKPKQA